MSAKLLVKGVYAVGFFFPVVAEGKARIRTQISAALTPQDIADAVQAFAECR
jgi:glycine C-acetyltransferase